MRLPKKAKPEFYRQMVEARYDPRPTSRWTPILEELAKDTPPPTADNAECAFAKSL